MVTPEPRPRAPRMSRDARRAQVLTVAQDLFARLGYHHVSMDDIADQAEVSKPVLYRHFPSKLDLYLDVIDHRGAALVVAVHEALAATPTGDGGAAGQDVVRAIVRAYVEFVEDAGESTALLFESDVTRDSGVRSRVEGASAEASRAISLALRDLAGLPPEHAELLTTALVGMVQVSASSRLRSRHVPVEDTVDLVTRLAWRGVAGLVRDHGETSGGPAGTSGADAAP